MKEGISIVICCYNSSSRIGTTLDYLLKQKVSANLNWEVIVVNNNSNDNTSEVVNRWINENRQFNLKIKLVDESTPGLSYAREKGVQESSYDIILFCDDDNHLCDSYIETGYEILKNNQKTGVLGGVGTPLFEGEKPFWFDNYMVNYATGIPHNPLRGIHKQKNPRWAYGAGVFIRKSLLSQLKDLGLKSLLSDRKGNSLTSGGDYELFYWIYILGHQVTYDEKLTFRHLVPASRATLDYLYRLASGLGESAALLEIYQYLLGTSFEIITPKRNIGYRIARHYLSKLLKMKLKIVLSKDRVSLNFINLNFGFFSIKGRVNKYLNVNNQFLELIASKEKTLKNYIDKL